MKAILVGSREGFRGVMETEEVYESILLGKTDFTSEQKHKITHYTIPASVFERLLKLDRDHLVNISDALKQIVDDGNKEAIEQMIADITKSDALHSLKCEHCKDPNGSSSYCASCACAMLAENLVSYGWIKPKQVEEESV